MTTKPAQQIVDEAIAADRGLTQPELLAVAAARRAARPAKDCTEIGAWTAEVSDHTGRADWSAAGRYTVRVWLTGTRGDGGYPRCIRQVGTQFATRAEADAAAAAWVAANGPKLKAWHDANPYR